MQTKIEQFSGIYEVPGFGEEKENSLKAFFIILAKSTAIFFLISFIVFFVVNYQFVKSQIIDWSQEGNSSNVADYLYDDDNDRLPDWWEKQHNLKLGFDDSKEDPDNDYANNLVEYLFGTDPNNPDTDGDGYFDGEEIKKGYNPSGKGRMDVDGDQIFDWWEQKFGFSDNDESDALLDLDGDGLSTLEEFIYQTDPRNPDTNGNGITDGEEVNSGKNPMGIKLPKSQEDQSDEDGDGLTLFYEYLFGTDPNNSDTDGDGYPDYTEIVWGYDPTSPTEMIKARILIPSIGVDAPIVWSNEEDEKQIEKDLENGVIRYPGTTFPGMRGNSYLTGHSSYYTWSSSLYKEVFKDLSKLKENDKVIINFTLENNKNLEFIYSIRSSELVEKADYRLFRDFEGYEMTLVTCWPLGTDWKRWMVKAELEYPKMKF